MFNDRKYPVFGKDQFGMMEGCGYVGGNYSTDGEFAIVNNGSSDPCPHINEDLAKPEYLLAYEELNDVVFEGWPQGISHEHAIVLVSLIEWAGEDED